MKTNIKTIIRKTRVSVGKLCEEYGVAKQTVSDIKKAKPKLMEYAAQYCVDATASKSGKGLPRKHMKTARETGLYASVMKWYVQERSVRGVMIMSAANRLAVLGNPCHSY